jgi:DNA-binding transcriptional MerR regulator
MDEKHWKIGDLARATGLSVRTLHHYDEIGLLVPSERTQAGYRLYGEDDVRRLYGIRVLRDLGIPLGKIPEALEGDLRATLARHLERVGRDLERQRRLQSLLQRILDAADTASGEDYMEAIEAMTMFEKYYTPGQLEQIEERRKSFSDEGIASGLKTMIEEEGPERATRGAVDAGLRQYVVDAIRLQL